MKNQFKDYGDPDFPGSGSMLVGCLYIGGGSKSSSTQATSTSTSTQINDSRMAASEGSIVAGAGSSISVQTNDAELIGRNNDAITDLAESSMETSSRALEAAIDGNTTVSRDALYSGERIALGTADAVSKVASDSVYSGERIALGSVDAVSRAASDSAYSSGKAAEAAISGNVTVSRDALDFGSGLARDAFNTVESIGYEGQLTARNALGVNREVTRDVLDFGTSNVRDSLDFVGQAQKEQNDLIRYTNEQFTAKLAANSGDAVQNVTKDLVKYGMIAVAVIAIAYAFKTKS